MIIFQEAYLNKMQKNTANISTSPHIFSINFYAKLKDKNKSNRKFSEKHLND